MTETREISRDTYRKISRKAGKLFDLISETMDTISTVNDEWDDLHSLMGLAHIISRTASRYAGLAPDPDAPPPYVPAEGMRDLQAAAKAPRVAITSAASFHSIDDARDGWTTT